ncbi:MAG: hypothetical protein CBC13_06895 [Planctomycetia bacterium TMED53]|nr:MAG: hypothetical protein CBC13_06895 [Planctomycetia bacterium TMED53]
MVRFAALTILLIGLFGCGQTPKKEMSSNSNDKTMVTEQSYSRVYNADELMGYVGHRNISVNVGGTSSNMATYSVYNKAFELLGTYDDAGNTRVFRRDKPILLGVFSPEDSLRQIMGIEGRLRVTDGLR